MSKDKGEPDQSGPPYTWTFDIDGTITSAPRQYARLAEALQAIGDKVVVVTGHGPARTRADLLTALNFPYDEILVVNPTDDGSGKRKALDELGAFMHFDDRIEFGPEILKVCPVTFQYSMPPGDEKPRKDAKKAAKALKGQRAITFTDGPLAGETHYTSGLTELIDIHNHTYREDGTHLETR